MTSESDIKTVMALGFFDGVHLGHAQLINMAKRRAAEKRAKPAVLSFDASPMAVVTGESIPLIGNTRTREETIKRFFGVDRVIIYHFDKSVMTMPWQGFIDSLVVRFSAIHFVIGHDFRCGYKGEGTPERISEYCAQRGLGCDIIPEFKLDGITVSSTHIKSLIAKGDIKSANRFLGRPYCISGEVQGGHKVGRKLGTPTINLSLDPEMALPAMGVYATKVRLGDTLKDAVTNVGVRPTFDNGNEVTVESFILDFSGDLYGSFVSVYFYEFLRPERKFSDANELSRQIQSDAQAARAVLYKIDLFGN